MNTVNELIKDGIREFLDASDTPKENFCKTMRCSPEMLEYLLSENSTVGSHLLDQVCEAYNVKPLLVLEPQ